MGREAGLDSRIVINNNTIHNIRNHTHKKRLNYLYENGMHPRTSHIQYIMENARAAVNYPCTELHTGTHILMAVQIYTVYIYIYTENRYILDQIRRRVETVW